MSMRTACSLAGADFTADLHDAFVIFDGVQQRVEQGAALRMAKNQAVCGVMRKGGSERPK